MAFKGLRRPLKARKKGLKNDDMTSFLTLSMILNFSKQTQAKGLVFMEKYASKHVYKLRKLKQHAAVTPKIVYFY